MKVTSKGIVNGVIDDRFGKRGMQFNKYGIPSNSLPFSIVDAPENTKAFAILLEDKDAAPVCGFSWIHWIAANITETEIAENASISSPDFVQGTNSWYGQNGREGSFGYGGMTPPDAPHEYELHVFALDEMLEIYNGFFVNELFKLMEGHVLGYARLKGSYSSR